MIKNAYDDVIAQATQDGDTDGLMERYDDKVNARNFDGQEEITEMDALVAYMQVLGTMAELKDYNPDVAKEAE